MPVPNRVLDNYATIADAAQLAITVIARSSGRASVRRVSMVRCAATRAGLGRFIYLQGQSGRRYVFSAITAEQAPLYGNGVFAAHAGEAGEVEVGFGAHDVAGRGALFVHLPDDGETASDVLGDL